MEHGDAGVKFLIMTIILGMSLLAIVYLMVSSKHKK